MGQHTIVSSKTVEIDQSSMISPPRDIDMTSQIEGSSENGVLLMDKKITKSVIGVQEKDNEEFKEFRKHSTKSHNQVTTTTATVTSSTSQVVTSN